jgi:hypothetical protein
LPEIKLQLLQEIPVMQRGNLSRRENPSFIETTPGINVAVYKIKHNVPRNLI